MDNVDVSDDKKKISCSSSGGNVIISMPSIIENINTDLPIEGKEVSSGNHWTPQIHVYIKSILDECQRFRNIHQESFIYYDTINNWFGLVNIFLGCVITAIGSAASIIPGLSVPGFSYSIVLLGLISTTVSSMYKFLNYSEYAHNHLSASKKFLELSTNLTQIFLVTPVTDRDDARKIINMASRIFRTIINNVREPPESILKKNKLKSLTPDIALESTEGAEPQPAEETTQYFDQFIVGFQGN